MLKHLFFGCILALLTAGCTSTNNTSTSDSKIVNVYTHRHYEVDKEIFKDFEKETGIVVNVISANSDELIMRLENEGEYTPADLFIAVDAARLERAKNKGLLISVTDTNINNNIPKSLRDKGQQWFGLTYRARIIVVDKNMADKPTTYADLALPKYKGKIGMRSSENEYNQSLLASIVAHTSKDSALTWTKNVVRNFARDPKGNDRDQVKTIAAGIAQLSVVNTYYLGKMHFGADEDEKKALEAIEVIFPDQAEGLNGAHINISGIGLTKHSKNKANAIKLMQYLCSVTVQEKFANANYEYPANPKAKTNGFLAGLGTFRADSLDLAKLGENNAAAVEIFQLANWN